MKYKKNGWVLMNLPPKVGHPTFGGIFLKERQYKKHSIEEKLAAIELYKQGYGSTTISQSLSVCKTLINEWINIYVTHGREGFIKLPNVRATFEMRSKIVRDILENNLSYQRASLIYSVSRSALHFWVSKVKQGGYTLLESIPDRGRPRKTMIRPKKKQAKTELEKLKSELEYLRAENAYLKKYNALVAEEELALKKRSKSKPSNH